ncbi:FtsX-like permease family protein [Actinotalea fermentans]|uniref:Permease n=1 Tax=Actinotalea fermentans TaxID=43671 RepID=A0A511Z0S7_9CELL|nr:FtsX-like permease family protein [Actinotalea fermentans]KGM16944.1 hypothetical protein N867_12735 [Actinotalea fermentans ATCC 43279 = JCM 9966 = DSM 3133]GEN81060.1 permease [Actinotalea fermentans]
MKAVLALAPRLQRSGGSLTTALAVVAFAVTTAMGLSVLGGLLGFIDRADRVPEGLDSHGVSAHENAELYVILATIAVVLLVVPLVSLAGAAARMGVARRDARLATLRLLGVTAREVRVVTAVETAAQGLAGAVLGIAGYGLLMPVWTRISFQGRPFDAGELWVGFAGIGGALVVVPLVAAASALVSLRRVVVSPLGVARRQTPPALSWLRTLGLLAAVGAFGLVVGAAGGMPQMIAVALLVGLLGTVFATLNLVGPWIVGVVGRVMAAAARTPATLLAARRLTDDPRAAWRVVGGLGMAAFVAGCLSVLPMFETTGEDPAADVITRDIVTGGVLTLAIAFAVAAVSAGIMQASSVLDRKREYALQRLAGAPVELFDAARRREVLAPLLLVTGTSSGVALLLVVLVIGTSGVTNVSGLALVLGFLAGGVALMLAATESSRPLLRSVLRETVVRAD